MSRFCSWVTLTLLLAIPAVRVVNVLNERTGNISWATLTPESILSAVSARWNEEPVYTADEMQNKAMPLLARLASEPGEPLVVRGMAGRADGTTQHTWTVLYTAVGMGSAAPSLAEADYDAGTGTLISASTLCDLSGQPYAIGGEGARQMTKTEAIEEARSWLSKLGLWGSSEASELPNDSPTIFEPQKTSAGVWRVWLQGREMPGGPPVTVLVAVSARSTARIRMRAVIVERTAMPATSLPRR